MGIDNKADIRAVDIVHHPNSVDFKVVSPGLKEKSV